MTSAFIIEVNSQLQPDPNEETAALLRVLIHKVDNTTFGDNVPSIPQWSGPPHMIVQVQAILFASLAASLFSAFLAMLGKQWVNRYASVDVRGSAIERGQNRQQKLDGVFSWYFDHVMESPPLMLQAALLLLGFALSRYLWEINTTVASVVLGFTSAGVLFFLFIVIAGACSTSCPYQTPGAQLLRQVPGPLRQFLDALRRVLDALRRTPGTIYQVLVVPYRVPDPLRRVPGFLRRVPDTLRYIPDTIRRVPHTFHQVFYPLVEGSICFRTLKRARGSLRKPSLVHNSTAFLFILLLPVWLTMDACMAIPWLLVWFSRPLERGSERQTALLDLRCILWTLQTSLDEPVRLSTLNYVASTTLADFDPALVVGCFNVLLGCVKAIDGQAVIAQGMEQLAAVSSMCCLQTLSHLMATDPTSRVLEDTGRRYIMAFPRGTHLNNLSISHILHAIHRLFNLDATSRYWQTIKQLLQWEGYEPPSAEHVIVAHAFVNVARSRYRGGGYGRVPRWILRFTLHSLSQSPLPSTSAVADCLSIIAITLDCDPLNTTASSERCVRA